MANKLNIEFRIQDKDTDRFLTISTDVSLHELRDWFKRLSAGIECVFGASVLETVYTVWIKTSEYSSKIPAIKLVRSLTGCGLKDAKDLVESNSSHAPAGCLLAVKGIAALRIVQNEFTKIGVDTYARDAGDDQSPFISAFMVHDIALRTII